MSIGPPASDSTLLGDRGGNSNSFNEIPADRTIALLNVIPVYWVLTNVLSVSSSKWITSAVNEAQATMTAQSAKYQHRIPGSL
jgi:hypothetical protein